MPQCEGDVDRVVCSVLLDRVVEYSSGYRSSRCLRMRIHVRNVDRPRAIVGCPLNSDRSASSRRSNMRRSAGWHQRSQSGLENAWYEDIAWHTMMHLPLVWSSHACGVRFASINSTRGVSQSALRLGGDRPAQNCSKQHRTRQNLANVRDATTVCQERLEEAISGFGGRTGS